MVLREHLIWGSEPIFRMVAFFKSGTLTALVLAEFSVKSPKNMRPDLYGEFYREH